MEIRTKRKKEVQAEKNNLKRITQIVSIVTAFALFVPIIIVSGKTGKNRVLDLENQALAAEEAIPKISPVFTPEVQDWE